MMIKKLLKPLVLLSGFLFLCAFAHASNPLYYYSLAEVALDQGDYATADSLLEIAYLIDPTSEEVILERLNVLYYLQDGGQLVSFAEDVLAKGIVLPEVYIMLAEGYLAEGDTKQARDILQEGLLQIEETSMLYIALYRVAAREGDGVSAMQYLHKAEYGTNDPDILYQIAMEYSRLQDNLMFEMTLQRILRIDPDFMQAHVWLGDFYYNEKDFFRSIKNLKFVLDNPVEITSITLRQLLLSYYFTQQFEEVLKLSEYFPLENMDSVQKRMFFFSAFKAMRFPEAIQYGEALVQEKDTMEPDRLQELYEMMAISEIQLQNYDRANYYFKEISDLRFLLPHLNILPFIVNETGDVSLFQELLVFADSTRADTLACTMKALLAYNYAKMESLKSSQKYLDEIELQNCMEDYPIVLIAYAKLKTGVPSDSVYALLENRPQKEMTSAQWLGQYYGDMEDVEKALYYYTLALEQDSTNLDLYLNVAQFYNRHDLFEQEIATLDRGVILFPNNPDLLNWLGYSLTEHDMRLDEARIMLEKAVQIASDNIYIWDSLGWVYYKLGLYQEALDAMQKVIESNAEDSVILYHIGLIYQGNAMPDKAKQALRRSVEINNNDDAVERAKNELKLIQ